MLGLIQLGGALRNWMPAKTQKTAPGVRIGQQPDPHRRQEGRRGALLCDLAVGQRFLQFGDARVGHLGSGESKRFQVGQALKVS